MKRPRDPLRISLDEVAQSITRIIGKHKNKRENNNEANNNKNSNAQKQPAALVKDGNGNNSKGEQGYLQITTTSSKTMTTNTVTRGLDEELLEPLYKLGFIIREAFYVVKSYDFFYIAFNESEKERNFHYLDFMGSPSSLRNDSINRDVDNDKEAKIGFDQSISIMDHKSFQRSSFSSSLAMTQQQSVMLFNTVLSRCAECNIPREKLDDIVQNNLLPALMSVGKLAALSSLWEHGSDQCHANKLYHNDEIGEINNSSCINSNGKIKGDNKRNSSLPISVSTMLKLMKLLVVGIDKHHEQLACELFNSYIERILLNDNKYTNHNNGNSCAITTAISREIEEVVRRDSCGGDWDFFMHSKYVTFLSFFSLIDVETLGKFILHHGAKLPITFFYLLGKLTVEVSRVEGGGGYFAFDLTDLATLWMKYVFTNDDNGKNQKNNLFFQKFNINHDNGLDNLLKNLWDTVLYSLFSFSSSAIIGSEKKEAEKKKKKGCAVINPVVINFVFSLFDKMPVNLKMEKIRCLLGSLNDFLCSAFPNNVINTICFLQSVFDILTSDNTQDESNNELSNNNNDMDDDNIKNMSFLCMKASDTQESESILLSKTNRKNEIHTHSQPRGFRCCNRKYPHHYSSQRKHEMLSELREGVLDYILFNEGYYGFSDAIVFPEMQSLVLEGEGCLVTLLRKITHREEGLRCWREFGEKLQKRVRYFANDDAVIAGGLESSLNSISVPFDNVKQRKEIHKTVVLFTLFCYVYPEDILTLRRLFSYLCGLLEKDGGKEVTTSGDEDNNKNNINLKSIISNCHAQLQSDGYLYCQANNILPLMNADLIVLVKILRNGAAKTLGKGILERFYNATRRSILLIPVVVENDIVSFVEGVGNAVEAIISFGQINKKILEDRQKIQLNISENKTTAMPGQTFNTNDSLENEYLSLQKEALIGVFLCSLDPNVIQGKSWEGATSVILKGLYSVIDQGGEMFDPHHLFLLLEALMKIPRGIGFLSQTPINICEELECVRHACKEATNGVIFISSNERGEEVSKNEESEGHLSRVTLNWLLLNCFGIFSFLQTNEITKETGVDFLLDALSAYFEKRINNNNGKEKSKNDDNIMRKVTKSVNAMHNMNIELSILGYIVAHYIEVGIPLSSQLPLSSLVNELTIEGILLLLGKRLCYFTSAQLTRMSDFFFFILTNVITSSSSCATANHTSNSKTYIEAMDSTVVMSSLLHFMPITEILYYKRNAAFSLLWRIPKKYLTDHHNENNNNKIKNNIVKISSNIKNNPLNEVIIASMLLPNNSIALETCSSLFPLDDSPSFKDFVAEFELIFSSLDDTTIAAVVLPSILATLRGKGCVAEGFQSESLKAVMPAEGHQGDMRCADDGNLKSFNNSDNNKKYSEFAEGINKLAFLLKCPVSQIPSVVKKNKTIFAMSYLLSPQYDSLVNFTAMWTVTGTSMNNWATALLSPFFQQQQLLYDQRQKKCSQGQPRGYVSDILFKLLDRIVTHVDLIPQFLFDTIVAYSNSRLTSKRYLIALRRLLDFIGTDISLTLTKVLPWLSLCVAADTFYHEDLIEIFNVLITKATDETIIDESTVTTNCKSREKYATKTAVVTANRFHEIRFSVAAAAALCFLKCCTQVPALTLHASIVFDTVVEQARQEEILNTQRRVPEGGLNALLLLLKYAEDATFINKNNKNDGDDKNEKRKKISVENNIDSEVGELHSNKGYNKLIPKIEGSSKKTDLSELLLNETLLYEITAGLARMIPLIAISWRRSVLGMYLKLLKRDHERTLQFQLIKCLYRSDLINVLILDEKCTEDAELLQMTLELIGLAGADAVMKCFRKREDFCTDKSMLATSDIMATPIFPSYSSSIYSDIDTAVAPQAYQQIGFDCSIATNWRSLVNFLLGEVAASAFGNNATPMSHDFVAFVVQKVIRCAIDAERKDGVVETSGNSRAIAAVEDTVSDVSSSSSSCLETRASSTYTSISSSDLMKYKWWSTLSVELMGTYAPYLTTSYARVGVIVKTEALSNVYTEGMATEEWFRKFSKIIIGFIDENSPFQVLFDGFRSLAISLHAKLRRRFITYLIVHMLATKYNDPQVQSIIEAELLAIGMDDRLEYALQLFDTCDCILTIDETCLKQMSTAAGVSEQHRQYVQRLAVSVKHYIEQFKVSAATRFGGTIPANSSFFFSSEVTKRKWRDVEQKKKKKEQDSASLSVITLHQCYLRGALEHKFYERFLRTVEGSQRLPCVGDVLPFNTALRECTSGLGDVESTKAIREASATLVVMDAAVLEQEGDLHGALQFVEAGSAASLALRCWKNINGRNLCNNNSFLSSVKKNGDVEEKELGSFFSNTEKKKNLPLGVKEHFRDISTLVRIARRCGNWDTALRVSREWRESASLLRKEDPSLHYETMEAAWRLGQWEEIPFQEFLEGKGRVNNNNSENININKKKSNINGTISGQQQYHHPSLAQPLKALVYGSCVQDAIQKEYDKIVQFIRNTPREEGSCVAKQFLIILQGISDIWFVSEQKMKYKGNQFTLFGSKDVNFFGEEERNDNKNARKKVSLVKTKISKSGFSSSNISGVNDNFPFLTYNRRESVCQFLLYRLKSSLERIGDTEGTLLALYDRLLQLTTTWEDDNCVEEGEAITDSLLAGDRISPLPSINKLRTEDFTIATEEEKLVTELSISKIKYMSTDKNYKGALATLWRAKAHHLSSSPSNEDIRIDLLIAKTLHRMGRLMEALNYAMKASTCDSLSNESRSLLLIKVAKWGQEIRYHSMSDTKKWLSKATELYSQSEEAHLALGLLHYEMFRRFFSAPGGNGGILLGIPRAVTSPTISKECSSVATEQNASSVESKKNDQSVTEILRLVNEHVLPGMDSFGKTLQISLKNLVTVMPRYFTMWMDGAAAVDSLTLTASLSARKADTLSCLSITASATERLIPTRAFFISLSQMLSRLGCHRNLDIVKHITSICRKLLEMAPQQVMWQLFPLLFSRNNEQRASLVKTSILGPYLRQSKINETIAKGMLTLFKALIEVCNSPPQQIINSKLTSLPRMNALLPLLQTTSFILPRVISVYPVVDRWNSEVGCEGDNISSKAIHGSADVPFIETDVFIASMSDTYNVMHSLMKPKRISLVDTRGCTHFYLMKSKDEPRKDIRMMEVIMVMNYIFAVGSDNPHVRQYMLKRYAVLALDDDCAMIEWVPDTKTVRSLVEHSYALDHSGVSISQVKAWKEECDKSHRSKELFLNYILPNAPPVFHQWFTRKFVNTLLWYSARKRYTQSAALWSMVGHIVGLGDRHSENLLICVNTGEVLHVDFACMFDNGERLTIPETVRFRLTPNIVDAMGITGSEGPFRCVCQQSLIALSDNKDIILGVLETLVHDPLVEWSSQNSIDPRALIERCARRLDGYLDIYGEPKDETALSVLGQVARLIKHSMSVKALSEMYIWWMPWI